MTCSYGISSFVGREVTYKDLSSAWELRLDTIKWCPNSRDHPEKDPGIVEERGAPPPSPPFF